MAEAYIAGIETCAAEGEPVKQVTSVASFFVSRIDALVDPLLEKLIAQGGKEADLTKRRVSGSCQHKTLKIRR